LEVCGAIVGGAGVLIVTVLARLTAVAPVATDIVAAVIAETLVGGRAEVTVDTFELTGVCGAEPARLTVCVAGALRCTVRCVRAFQTAGAGGLSAAFETLPCGVTTFHGGKLGVDTGAACARGPRRRKRDFTARESTRVSPAGVGTAAVLRRSARATLAQEAGLGLRVGEPVTESVVAYSPVVVGLGTCEEEGALVLGADVAVVTVHVVVTAGAICAAEVVLTVSGGALVTVVTRLAIGPLGEAETIVAPESQLAIGVFIATACAGGGRGAL